MSTSITLAIFPLAKARYMAEPSVSVNKLGAVTATIYLSVFKELKESRKTRE